KNIPIILLQLSLQTKKKALDKGNKCSKISWIWQHFKKTKIRDVDGEKIPIIVCQEKNDDNTNYDTSYVYTSRSTGNAIVHLQNMHEITKQGKTKVCN
ncbi:7106_t:CDS:1, partial [Racocetra persica]